MAYSLNRRLFIAGTGGAALLSANSVFAGSGATGVVKAYKYISGFQPDILNNTTVRLYPGSVADEDGDVYYSSTSIDLDISTSGVGGLDAGVPVHTRDYFIWIVRDTSDDSLSGVFTHEQGVVNVAANLPSGYVVVRKLRFGLIYRTDWPGGAGFSPIHVAGWPHPYIRYTDFETGSPWQALASGTASGWTDIPLKNYLPDNARLANIMTVVTSQQTAGSAFIRSYSGQSNGILVGSSNPIDATFERLTLDIRVDSLRNFQYKVIGGARLDVFCMGYYMTEPS